MAQVLQITDGSSTVNLLTGNLYVEAGGFSYASVEDESLLWTTFDILSTASAANIRTEMVKFEKLIEQAKNYHNDINENDPVWLYWQSEGESAKRALIHDGTFSLENMGRYSPLLVVDGLVATLAVQHSKIFEATSATSANQTTVSVIGGTWVIGNDAGNYPQRISEFKIGTATHSCVRLYVGIRKLRQGTAGFEPKWECENGYNFPATGTSDVADGDASGGNCVEIDFTTYDTLINRFYVQWDDVAGSNYDDIIGTYLVLGRLKLTAGTSVTRVQLRGGWNGEEIIGDTYLDTGVHSELNGNYCLVPLGEAKIPPTGNRGSLASTSDMIRKYMLKIYAQKVSGLAKLRCDCFILIPSEHLMIVEEGSVTTSPTTTYGYTLEDGSQYAWTKGSTYPGGDAGGNFSNWHYPIGGGVAVIAACGASDSIISANKAGTVRLDIDLYPRYLSYRT